MASLLEHKTLPELMWSAGLSCAAMIRLLPYSTGWNGTYPGLMGVAKLLCLSGDRRKEKEAQDQDVENSFTANHLTLSNLLHVTKSNPSLCHGNQSDQQRPSGTIPPPSPPYQPTLPPLYTQMDSQGFGPTRSQRIATSPWSATRGLVTNWSRAGPILIWQQIISDPTRFTWNTSGQGLNTGIEWGALFVVLREGEELPLSD